MKFKYRVVLILLLLSVSLLSLAPTASALVASQGTFGYFEFIPVNLSFGWADMLWDGVSYHRGSLTDTLGMASNAVDSEDDSFTYGAVYTVSTLYPSSDGRVVKRQQLYGLQTADSNSALWYCYYSYLLENSNRHCYYDSNPVFSATDFYLPPTSTEYVDASYYGFGIEILSLQNIGDVTLNIEYRIRPLGDHDGFEVYSEVVASNSFVFSGENLFSILDSPLYYDSLGSFKGCYVDYVNITVNGDPYVYSEGSYPNGTPDYKNDNVLLQFNYYWGTMDEDAYSTIVEFDHYEAYNSEIVRDYTGWMATAVSGFFGAEIFPGFSLGGIVIMCIAFAVSIWLLKIFAGG